MASRHHRTIMRGEPLVSEILVLGNGVEIVNGDSTPSAGDHTNYGISPVGTPISRIYTIQNTGTADLTGINVSVPSGFTLTSAPSATIAAGGSSTFTVRGDAGSRATFSGNISIANSDSDENPYVFAITFQAIQAEMNVIGNSVSIADGDSSPTTADHTDFGSTPVGITVTRTFTIENLGDDTLTITTPITVPSGFTCTSQPATSVAAGGSTTFQVRADASALQTYSGQISIANSDADENPYNFTITVTATAHFKDTFANAAAAPLAATASADTIGTWVTVDVENLMSVSGGKLQVPAQASAVWGEEYRRAQPDTSTQFWTRPTGKALVAVATFNQSTRNSQIPVGWFNAATLGLNANTRGAVYTNTNVLQAAQGGSGVSDAQAQSASTDYNGIAVWTSWGVLTYIKISGIWHLKWVRPDVFTDGYCGITNLNAIGTIDNFKIVAVDESVFNPALDITSPTVGNLANMPDGDFLMQYPVTTVPSANNIDLFFRKQSASNKWNNQTRTGGAQFLQEIISSSNNRANTAAGAVTNGATITSIARAQVIADWINTTSAWSYSSAFNFLREVGLELNSLGTGGAIGSLKAWKARLLDESGLGADVVVNGNFATDTVWSKGTDWTISGGTANKAAGAGASNLNQTSILTSGTYYKLVFTISNYVAGTLTPILGSSATLAAASANGTFTYYGVSNGTTLTLQASAAGNFSLDTVSCEPVNFTDDSLALILNGVLVA